MKNLFIFIFIITFLGNCTKEIISSRNTSEFLFSSTYFDYNPYSNELYLYAEIENVTLTNDIDSVWAELFNSENTKINDYQLMPSQSANDQLTILNIYSIKDTIYDLQSDVYSVLFKMKDELGNLFFKRSDKKDLTINTDPIVPQIIDYSISYSINDTSKLDTFILGSSEWKELYIKLYVVDENGSGDISKVKYKVKRSCQFLYSCSDNDICSDPGYQIEDYKDLGDSNTPWEFIFEKFGSNNIFIYYTLIRMRPENGAALYDDEGNIQPGYEETGCGKTGTVSFQFIVTDQSGLTDLIEDIQIEIIKP